MCHPRTTSWLVANCPVAVQWQRQDASLLQTGGLLLGTVYTIWEISLFAGISRYLFTLSLGLGC